MTLWLTLTLILAAGGLLAWKSRGTSREAPALPPKPGRLGIGDVVSIGGEELWVTGLVRATEAERTLAIVFHAGSRTVVEDSDGVLYDCESVALSLEGEPPPTVSAAGEIWERSRRWPASFAAQGDAPRIESTGFFGAYRDAAGRALFVLACPSLTLAYRGGPLDAESLVRWGTVPERPG